MAIQYPKWEHATLPSVEGWNNLNILRDPPKSIFTKRIDKVGQNNDIINLIDSSGDRAVEGISVYSRGVNPMVSVSYDNNSNNAGAFNNGLSKNGGTQAFLPYRIMDQGAFRPPIRTSRDLLPLSRQPRAWFQALSNPGFIDYSKQKYTPTQFRMIRDLLKTEQLIKPNKSQNVDKPIENNYNMKEHINDMHINISADSGKRSMDMSNYTRENVDVATKKSIQENYEEINAITNKVQYRAQNLSNIGIDDKKYIQNLLQHQSTTNFSSRQTQGLNNIGFDHNKYINNKEYTDAFTNKNLDINVKTIDELQTNNRTNIKDILQYGSESGQNTGYTLPVINPDIETERNMPYYDMQTALSDPTVYKRVEHENEIKLNRVMPEQSARTIVARIEDLENYEYASSRDFKLLPKITKGEFLNEGIKPTIQRNTDKQLRVDSNKDNIRKYMNENQFGRYGKAAQFS